MQLRSTVTQAVDTQLVSRQPLLDSKLDLNAIDDQKGQSQRVARSPRKKASTLSESPARRAPRALSSPARRQIPPLTCSRLRAKEELQESPIKRNLGSPLRQVSNDATSVSVFHRAKKGSTLSTMTLSPPKREIREAVICKARTVPISPLKSPARRIQILPALVPKDKKERSLTPSSSRRSNLAKEHRSNHEAETDEIAYSKDVELAEMTSQGQEIEEAVMTPTRPSKKCQTLPLDNETSTAGLDLCRPVDDEIAAASYTPIRTPARPSSVYSPPSDDVAMDEHDLWLPSIPLLSKSFSDLSLATKASSHTFFDDSGRAMSEEEVSMLQLPVQKLSAIEESPKTATTVFLDCKDEDSSSQLEMLISMLTSLGAKTVRRWNWNPTTQSNLKRISKVGITHVIFSDGSMRTLKKIRQAREMGIDVKCIRPSWVVQCYEDHTLDCNVESHEINVDAELSRCTNAKQSSVVVLPVPVHAKEEKSSLAFEEFQAPVKFGDDSDNIFSSEHKSPIKLFTASILPPPQKSSKLTEFESKQLAAARRNSAKFRPQISSPLSKKAWRT